MTQNVDRETVVSRLLAADDILILCHKNPDGDTIGSGTALCLALQQLGKNAAVIGEVITEQKVRLIGSFGQSRLLDLPVTEPLPRIC